MFSKDFLCVQIKSIEDKGRQASITDAPSKHILHHNPSFQPLFEGIVRSEFNFYPLTTHPDFNGGSRDTDFHRAKKKSTQGKSVVPLCTRKYSQSKCSEDVAVQFALKQQ